VSKLLFKLHGVPEDEVEEVRALLAESDIECYETGAGNWGISMHALWIKHDQQFALAQELFDGYQEQRAMQARQEYELDRQQGQEKTFWTNFREVPVRVSAYLIFTGLVCYFSLKFFLGVL